MQAEGDLRACCCAARSATSERRRHAAWWTTQVYQAILERNPAPVIPRLKEIVAKPDPALGYLNGDLRFYLGWAQEVAGDHAAASGKLESRRAANWNLFSKNSRKNWGLIV